MHRFSHGTMPLRNIFKVSPQLPVRVLQPRPYPPWSPSPGSCPPLGQAPPRPCSLSELHLLLGLRRVDGLLHQPPSLHTAK